MIGPLDYVFRLILEHISNAFVYITDAISLFIVYIEAEVPFFSFCISVFNVTPKPFRDICFMTVTVMFINFLFSSLRRGK